MKIDFTSHKIYSLLLVAALAAAGISFLLTPMVLISQVAGYRNVVISGHHILFANSGLEALFANAPAGHRDETVALNPQMFIFVSYAFLLVSVGLALLKKKTFFPILTIVASVAFAYLACDHFGWLERSNYEFLWGFNVFVAFMLLAMVLTFVSAGLSKLKVRSGEFKDHVALLTMLIPGTIFLVVFAYFPMPGILIAFKNMRLLGSSLFENFFKSSWVGFNNFRFMFATPDAFNMTRNTVLYNLTFMALGLVAAVAIAIGITEISNRRTAKLYQTLYFLPFFLSWVVVSYLTFALLSYDYGALNGILRAFGMPEVEWYITTKYWPYIFVIANLWKYAGNGSIIYTATIVGIDTALFEAAAIDGANRIKQIWHITLPMLKPIMILLSILSVGRIFNADFGLFYLIPRSGAIRSVSLVIDVYVYQGLTSGSVNIGMVSAAALYQSAVGFVLILLTNWIVSKISPDNTLL